MFYSVNDAERVGLLFAYFDSAEIVIEHLYDAKSGTLCGRHKNEVPLKLRRPHYYTNICGQCIRILKSRIKGVTQ